MRTLWHRIQEQPMELALALLGALAGPFILLGHLDETSIFTIFFYTALTIGGVGVIGGMLRRNLDIEAFGLALLLGAYSFITLRSLSYAMGPWQVALVLLNAGSIALGFGIRLYVVRKAQAVRRRVARRLRDG